MGRSAAGDADSENSWLTALRVRIHGGENLSNNLVFRQIIQYWDANLQASGTIFAHVYGALKSKTYK